MIPRANTVTLERLPPENMSTKPNQVARFWSKKSVRALASTPGVGT